jgi:NAD(P)H-dependent flavin oxidoreductase YrpB (nitropropane dioxygenase family)
VTAAPQDISPRLGATDLEGRLLPAGQDAAFARALADRFRTAGGVKHAIESAIDEHLRLAREHEPLAPGSALARAHGTRYPITQGPMTRVSDRAAFADAVSRAGGLPFLALSLLRGDEVRALLEETAALLGDRAWGVGILGFVPESLREEQLAVVRELRPSVALIAGGRPSQARPLEAQGTATYLHVPSPGLLDLFLADGARRFVFEGRECGGHVGPRTSFALWEMQIERLLAHRARGRRARAVRGRRPRRALGRDGGGDGRAARGARREGRRAPGHRVPLHRGGRVDGRDPAGFQREAIDCEQTVLLETAPGHATRCAETDYVRAFVAEKRRLEARANPDRRGVGRPRAAQPRPPAHRRRRGSRARASASSRSTSDAAREGMFMIGQVAALRREVVPVAELHRDVSEGGTARIASDGERR